MTYEDLDDFLVELAKKWNETQGMNSADAARKAKIEKMISFLTGKHNKVKELLQAKEVFQLESKKGGPAPRPEPKAGSASDEVVPIAKSSTPVTAAASAMPPPASKPITSDKFLAAAGPNRAAGPVGIAAARGRIAERRRVVGIAQRVAIRRARDAALLESRGRGRGEYGGGGHGCRRGGGRHSWA